jgi:hypothetical protein
MPLTAINADECSRVSVCRFGFVQGDLSPAKITSKNESHGPSRSILRVAADLPGGTRGVSANTAYK